MVIGFILMLFWAFLLHCFVGSFVPFISSWASLAIFLILHSYRLVLTHLSFYGPITLPFIPRAYGLSINPLLSLLALLRSWYDPLSLFYITYCPWICYFSFQTPLGSFASSRPICLFYGFMINYSYHLDLMVFLSTH